MMKYFGLSVLPDFTSQSLLLPLWVPVFRYSLLMKRSQEGWDFSPKEEEKIILVLVPVTFFVGRLLPHEKLIGQTFV